MSVAVLCILCKFYQHVLLTKLKLDCLVSLSTNSAAFIYCVDQAVEISNHQSSQTHRVQDIQLDSLYDCIGIKPFFFFFFVVAKQSIY
jgi:hypothetical protein